MTYWKCVNCPQHWAKIFTINKVYRYKNFFENNLIEDGASTPMSYNSLGPFWPNFKEVTKKYNTQLGKLFYKEE